MPERPEDYASRERFKTQIHRNFAVAANAGSGKTTAISERLAEMALDPNAGALLRKTAVVTYTKKAAAQIGQRARNVLLRRLADSKQKNLEALDTLERAFFGTIHSFCVVLAQRYGQNLGINLNPTLVESEEDERLWEEFLESDPMEFASLGSGQVDAFLRHVRLESIFELAKSMDSRAAQDWRKQTVSGLPKPNDSVLSDILALKSPRSPEKLQTNKDRASDWLIRLSQGGGFLAIPEPDGTAANIKEHYERLFGPMKAWLATAGAVLAAELALRFRDWRFARGVQNYADQVDAAVAILEHPQTLERIRSEGWRVILDEAQDTDAKQFAVLVEITRPPGSEYRSWPGRGPGPIDGHFCMVGDLQQGIYGSRADIRNFQRYMAEFERGHGGEKLVFSVTFRTPAPVAQFLNQTLPSSFGPEREHNMGLPVSEGAPAPRLQVDYVPLVAGAEAEGAIAALDFELPETGGSEAQMAAEARALAEVLKKEGFGRFGAAHWGEICILAPRNKWLATAKRQFEAVGLKVSVQMRRSRNGDSPPYAWLCGLLSVICEPTDLFEWTGVLRELFCVSDAEIAALLRSDKAIHWDDPERHHGLIGSAVTTLGPFIMRADEEGDSLEGFACALIGACHLREKAHALDSSGELEAELDAIIARATDLGIEGASVRQWRQSMLGALEGTRASGHASDDAITLATSHSSKGLEWPVVIPLGLWRRIYGAEGRGIRILTEAGGKSRVYFDSGSVPEETKLAREREWVRELVRLLYVTLTRTQRVLVIPRTTGGGKLPATSFQALWGASLASLPAVETLDFAKPASQERVAAPPPESPPEASGHPAVPLPKRLLPHQLSEHPDLIRASRHESGLDEPFVSSRRNEDPIEYGLWWHETMEFLPWEGTDEVVAAYGRQRLDEAARTGLARRGTLEWAKLLAGKAWRELRDRRWTRLAELSVFSPLGTEGWIDGVIDLVLHDRQANEVRIVDWKTNARRGGEADQALMDRLLAEYAPQLGAYAACATGLFPGSRVSVYLLATELGTWEQVRSPSGRR